MTHTYFWIIFPFHMLTSYSMSPSFPSSVCPMALWSRPMRRVRWSSCRTCWRSRTTSWPRWRSACPPSPPGFPRWSRSSRPPARTSSSQRRWTTSTRGTSKRSQHRNWAQGEAYTHTHIRMGITVARETSKTASSGLKTASICICSHTLPSSLLLRLFLT